MFVVHNIGFYCIIYLPTVQDSYVFVTVFTFVTVMKIFCREYEELQGERAGRRRGRHPPLPKFVDWLHDRVQSMIDNGERAETDLALMSSLSSREAKEYNAMWAYGNHYRCLPEDKSITHEMFDFGVFVMSPQGCRASNRTQILWTPTSPTLAY